MTFGLSLLHAKLPYNSLVWLLSGIPTSSVASTSDQSILLIFYRAHMVACGDRADGSRLSVGLEYSLKRS